MVTRPGIHNDVDLNGYPREVQTLIRKISKDFYVTRSFNTEFVGNSQYYAILARPSDEFSIHLNADREMVFVFSPYENFEIRTLEAFDIFYSLLEQKRVDKSIRFLICADTRVETIVRHYLDQNPEYPIIVPASFSDFSSGSSALLDALRRNYVLRDLFGYQNPLREETFFFGRQDVVNSVLDLAKSGQSSSLFGLRKSGKTSTIYAIQRKAKAFGMVFVLIDCQSPAVHARNYDGFLSFFVSQCREAVGQKKRVETLGSSPSEVAEAFTENMRNLVGQAKGKILLAFDEIENISPGTASSSHWETGDDALLVWQTLRSFIQTDSKNRLAICIVGTSPRLLEVENINGKPNPIYLYSQKRFIPNFSLSDTREMINSLSYFMGLEFSDMQVSDLQRRYGGHPFFIRQVCSQVHQISDLNRPLQVSNKLLKEAMTRFDGQMDSYLSDILGNLRRLYPEEHKLLEAVSQGDNDEVSEFGRDAPDLIDHLIGYGIVEQRGGEYDIRFEAISKALKKEYGGDVQRERKRELSDRRNVLEKEIRSALYYWCQSVDDNLWAEVARRRLSQQSIANFTSLEPKYIFSSKTSPLYFSDLIRLLKDDRVLPYLSERRADVISCMNVVNLHRKADAHAVDISDGEWLELLSALDNLENEFTPI